VSVINTVTNKVTHTIHVGSGPNGVAVDPAAHAVYVANAIGTVSVIDTATNTVTHTIHVNGSNGLAVDPALHAVYVAGGNNGLSVIDTVTNTVTHTIPTSTGGTYAVAVDPAAGTVYAVEGAGGNVYVISAATRRVTATIYLGGYDYLAGIAANPWTHTAYAVSGWYSAASGFYPEGTLSVISRST
jgi:YVTN family beta-propeller protein